MGLGIDPAAVEVANRTLGEFIAQTPDFYNSAENCKALQNYLRKEGLPVEQWCHVNIWAAAYWQCAKDGLLASPPPPKKRADIEAELNARDRYDGSRAGNRDRESPYDKATKLKKEIEERQAAELKKMQEESDARIAAKSAAEDLSVVPTLAQFRAGESLTPEQYSKLSTQQLRLYIRREAEAKQLNAADRAAERRRQREL